MSQSLADRWNRNSAVRGLAFGRGAVCSSWASSHLTGRDELQRPESRLEVGSVGLEVVEGAGNGLLDLGGVLAARAVGRDLVEGRRAHVGGCRRCRWVDWGTRRIERGSPGGKSLEAASDFGWSLEFGGWLGFAALKLCGGSTCWEWQAVWLTKKWACLRTTATGSAQQTHNSSIHLSP
ncbi:hypothetical protein VTJ49DRAFT_1127 [Mycothermus thermophilus]|uniref:Uncharacterized protein n=1 Tax=Humicola insolens TaxID=85995 RepID=A0ABR3VNR5_HUMIN